MKKKIIVEEVNNPKVSPFQRIIHHKFFEWLLYMLYDCIDYGICFI